ncbi:hypothetical protein BML2537_06030 [Providencia stuartii]|nr:hypothetical protein BML2537_06030 [Providencia stuartii]GHC01678.1 hypothetical protein GCM10007290_32420 [Providencia thailandensis]
MGRADRIFVMACCSETSPATIATKRESLNNAIEGTDLIPYIGARVGD